MATKAKPVVKPKATKGKTAPVAQKAAVKKPVPKKVPAPSVNAVPLVTTSGILNDMEARLALAVS